MIHDPIHMSKIKAETNNKDVIKKMEDLLGLIKFIDEKILPNKTQRKIFWKQFIKDHKIRKDTLSKLIISMRKK